MKTIYTLIILLSIPISNTYSQWVRTNGTFSGSCSSIVVFSNKIFIATTESGIYMTPDEGQTWTAVNSGLTGLVIESMISSGNNLLAGVRETGLFLSSNEGANWSLINNELSTKTIYFLIQDGTNLYAGTNTGIYKSVNGGIDWSSLNNGNSVQFVYGILVDGNNIFISGAGGVNYSSNSGSNWLTVNNGLGCTDLYGLLKIGNIILTGANCGIYQTTNNGNTWTNASTGIVGNFSAVSFLLSGQYVLVGTSQGIYRSQNQNFNWTSISEGFLTQYSYVTQISIKGTNIFASVDSMGTIGTSRILKRPLTEVIGIEMISSEVPKNFILTQNYPNPFNPKTNILIELKESGDVKLIVYDVLGNEVATLISQGMKPGTYNVDWNASNYPSGIYLYRMEMSNFVETKKMVLIK